MNSQKLVPELYCSDFKKSLEFYTGVLDFSIKFDRPEEGFAYLEREGAELMLDTLGQTRIWLKGSLEYPFGRGINLQIETSDVDALYESVQKSGADVFLKMENKSYRCGDETKTNRQFIVCDPDGYLLRFYQDVSA